MIVFGWIFFGLLSVALLSLIRTAWQARADFHVALSAAQRPAIPVEGPVFLGAEITNLLSASIERRQGNAAMGERVFITMPHIRKEIGVLLAKSDPFELSSNLYFESESASIKNDPFDIGESLSVLSASIYTSRTLQ